MAYDSSVDQAQDEQRQGQGTLAGGQDPSQGATLSGGGGGFAGQGGAPVANSASSSQAPTSSGSWTNLNSYLDANKDQSHAMGSQIANTVGGQASKAQSDLGNVVQGYQNQAPYQALNNTTDSQVTQAFADPSQYAAAGADISKPESYLNNDWGLNSTNGDITQYAPTTGPGWSDVSNSYNTAGTALGNTQTEHGRQLLLQDQYGQGGQQYNAGEQKFDQLLLQQDPNNQGALNSLYHQYAPGILSAAGQSNPADLQNAYNNATDYAKAEAAKGAGFQTLASGALGSQIGNLGSAVAGDTSAANAKYSSDYDALLGKLNNFGNTPSNVNSPQSSGAGPSANDTLSSNDMTKLGISGWNGYGSSTPGHSAKNFLGAKQNNPYSANDAATASDWGNFQGLNALIGGYNGADKASDLSKLNSSGLIGAAPAQPATHDPYSQFDSAGFNSTIKNAPSPTPVRPAPTPPGITAITPPSRGYDLPPAVTPSPAAPPATGTLPSNVAYTPPPKNATPAVSPSVGPDDAYKLMKSGQWTQSQYNDWVNQESAALTKQYGGK